MRRMRRKKCKLEPRRVCVATNMRQDEMRPRFAVGDGHRLRMFNVYECEEHENAHTCWI